jgi:hypothetical protein
MALMEAPEWVDRLSVDIAIALATAIGVTWLVLVAPDPEPLVSLPRIVGASPAVWLPIGLFVIVFPVTRFLRRPA